MTYNVTSANVATAINGVATGTTPLTSVSITGGSVTGVNGVALSFNNVTSMVNYNASGFSGGNTYTAYVSGYNSAGDGGGGLFVYAPNNVVPANNVVHFLSTGTSGRWVRQLPGNFLTLEMAGGAGDYIYPGMAWTASTSYGGTVRIQNGSNMYWTQNGGTSAASGGPTGTGTAISDGTIIWIYLGVVDTGTNNTNAMNAINNTVAFNQIAGFSSVTISLLPGKSYLFSTDCSVVTGAQIIGSAWRCPYKSTTNGPVYNLNSWTGSNIIVDPAAVFNLNQGCLLNNVTIARRNMLQNPTTAQVISHFNLLASELSPGYVWQPSTAYSLNAIIVNIQGVYKCDTAGTSGAYLTGGPTGTVTTTNGITDGTAKWHFVNQLQWTHSTAYIAGTVITMFDNTNNGNIGHLNAYVCDTAGTSGSGTFAPGGTSATTNGITDGTAKWHFIGKVSTGVSMWQQLSAMKDCTVIGFAVGVIGIQGCSSMENIYMDNLINLDMSGTGDTNIYDHIHCIPIYQPTADSPPDTTWMRKPATSLFFHEQVDTPIIENCECENWAVGMRLSNVWGPTVTRCHIENAPISVTNDACFQLRNVCSYLEFTENYADGMICYDISCTDTAHATTTSIAQGSSALLFRGGQAAVSNSSGKYFAISGNANGSISDMHINGQGGAVFSFAAANGGSVCWNINNIRIDEATLVPNFTNLMNAIDSTMRPYVHFAGIWNANYNRWGIPPGYDDSSDVVAAPTTGGTHTMADNTGWCYLANASTLASYSVITPGTPLGNGEIMISAKSAITTFSVTPNTGQTVDSSPTTLVAHGAVRYKYIYSSATWVRLIMS